jgi:hypothetical protein
MSCALLVGLTSAIVDIVADDSVTFADAFQFGVDGDTWDFAGQNFKMDVKANKDDTVVLFSLTSVNDRIVVVDSANRILQFNVASAVLAAALAPGKYVYALVMYDNSVPSNEVGLMTGSLTITHGVTQS